jgi:hypothetical protein
MKNRIHVVAGLGIALLLLARPASGAELAVLRNGFSIRHEHHQVMGATTRLFLDADDSSFTDVPTADIASYEKDLSLFEPADAHTSVSTPFEAARAMAPRSAAASQSAVAPQSKSAPPLSEVVNNASAAYHLDPDLVNSVIHAESGFNAHAVSPKGARGLMQLMPGTANQLGVNDAFDPAVNVAGGSKYLRELLEQYNFDLVKALAAYNAGPKRVDQYRGVPPFRETRAYVARIVHEYNKKKTAQENQAKQKTQATKPSGKPVGKPKPANTPSKTTIAAKSSTTQTPR